MADNNEDTHRGTRHAASKTTREAASSNHRGECDVCQNVALRRLCTRLEKKVGARRSAKQCLKERLHENKHAYAYKLNVRLMVHMKQMECM